MTLAISRISPAEAHAKMTDEGFVYVDVRTPEEFADGHPATAINIPVGETFVADMTARFPLDAKIILGCKTGNRSARAAQALTAVGFTTILDQRAGWDAARGSFNELLEPGWSRLPLPKE